MEVTVVRRTLEQTGGTDTERVVNAAPGSPRTACHAVITSNTTGGARLEAGERREGKEEIT